MCYRPRVLPVLSALRATDVVGGLSSAGEESRSFYKITFLPFLFMTKLMTSGELGLNVYFRKCRDPNATF